MEDLRAHFDPNDAKLNKVLETLEGKGLVKLLRDNEGIALPRPPTNAWKRLSFDLIDGFPLGPKRIISLDNMKRAAPGCDTHTRRENPLI
jgi:hypothetical protein